MNDQPKNQNNEFQEEDYNHERFIKFHLCNQPQVFKAENFYEFGKINTKMAHSRYLNYKLISCPFCKIRLCKIKPEELDECTKNYSTKVRGYDQLCHKCGEELCRVYGKVYESLCHHKSPEPISRKYAHRSGIYVKKHDIEMINAGFKELEDEDKMKNKRKLMCKIMNKSCDGGVYIRILILHHGWLY